MVVRGTLGVESQNLTAQIAQGLGLGESRGALITRVLAGSAAATAGLKPGDVVVSANGQRVDSAEALHNVEGLAAVGSPLTLDVRREGKPLQIKATLKEQARAVTGDSLDPRLGGATFRRPARIAAPVGRWRRTGQRGQARQSRGQQRPAAGRHHHRRHGG